MELFFWLLSFCKIPSIECHTTCSTPRGTWSRDPVWISSRFVTRPSLVNDSFADPDLSRTNPELPVEPEMFVTVPPPPPPSARGASVVIHQKSVCFWHSYFLSLSSLSLSLSRSHQNKTGIFTSSIFTSLSPTTSYLHTSFFLHQEPAISRRIDSHENLKPWQQRKQQYRCEP